MVTMDYIARLTFNDFGYAETLTICDVSTRGTDTVSICNRIPPHLKTKEDVKFGVQHVLVEFYRKRLTTTRNDKDDDDEEGGRRDRHPRIGTVHKKTFYLLRGLWPNVTLLPEENVDRLRREMIANVKDHGSIVHIVFDDILEETPSMLYRFNTEEPYEVTRLDLKGCSSSTTTDELIYETLNKNGGGIRYEVRHRILDVYQENVGTRDVKTFEYLRKTWPRISFLGQIDIGKAMMELTAEKYRRPENRERV